MKLLTTTGIAGLLAAGLLAAAPAAAQSDIRPLLDRIERMERDMSTLQRQVYRGAGSAAESGAGGTTVITSPALGGGGPAALGAPGPQVLPEDAAARIEVRLQGLEEQIRRLTGQVEENQFRGMQVKEQLERLQKDVELRFQELGAGTAVAAGAPPAAGAAGETPPASGQPGVLGQMPQKDLEQQTAGAAAPPAAPALQGETAKEQYEYAYGLVMKDRDAAERALKAFINAHPSDQLTGNAYYWLGETYFVKGDFKQAAVQFLDGYRKFPKSQKAPHNLLKLGISMVKMNDEKGACAAFARLASEFPDAEPAIKRAAQAEKQKIKCQ